MPAPRAFAAATAGTRYNSRYDGSALYVIGGIDAAGAIAVVRRGRIYVTGGTDSLGRPQQAVYVGRIGVTGHIDGWYLEPRSRRRGRTEAGSCWSNGPWRSAG